MPVFTANIPYVLKIGDRIEIGGKIKDTARKMSLNLCAQEGEEPPDVVLHFDVRFHRDNIVSLSRKNGVWIGSGNYDTNYNMFVPGTLFRVTFEVKASDVITIYCQGKFHSNFLPKIPLSMARFVVAWADVEKITHCYFHYGKCESAGDVLPPAKVSTSNESKRCPKLPKKIFPPSSARRPVTPEDSSDEEMKTDKQTNQISPRIHNKTQKSKSYGSDSDTTLRSSDTCPRGNMSVESDPVTNRDRSGRLSHFQQVVNFMGRANRKNAYCQ